MGGSPRAKAQVELRVDKMGVKSLPFSTVHEEQGSLQMCPQV